MRKLIIAVCMVCAIAALAACSGGAGSSKLTDFGWASFEMPDGYVQVDGLVNDVTISTSKDTDPMNYKLDESTIVLSPKVREAAWPDAESGLAGLVGKSPDRYGDMKTVEIGGREWHIVPFTFKDAQDSVMGYADVNDKRCVGFTAYYMGIDDPALQTVLGTLEINEAKLP